MCVCVCISIYMSVCIIYESCVLYFLVRLSTSRDVIVNRRCSLAYF